jgi:hypothetical protein
VEGRTARHQDLQASASPEQLAHERRGREHLFEIVEQQNELLVAQVVLEAIDQRSAALGAESERLGDRGRNQGRVVDRCQCDEADSVLEAIAQLGGDLQAETGLAGAARAGQRQQADIRVEQQLLRHGDFPVAPDERRTLER